MIVNLRKISRVKTFFSSDEKWYLKGMEKADPRFLCDAMLGRLANWLRLLGYDCEYSNDLVHSDLIARAKHEDRILLTRNRRLICRREMKEIQFLFIEHNDFRDQLRQLAKAYSLSTEKIGTRCSRCNYLLEPRSKLAISHIVPFFVATSQNSFAQCPECFRVYWPSTHVVRMNKEIQNILETNKHN